MSQPQQSKDYYAILGAEEDATRSEIDRLYRRKAVLHHPDRGGSEEEMKSLNEAYGVLKDEEARRVYDSGRQQAQPEYYSEMNRNVPPHSSGPVQLDAITHQVGAALMFLVLGLVLLFIVRFQYVMFLWPLALLALFMIVVGIVQAHAVMGAARNMLRQSHPARKLVWMQETAFWSVIFGGGYGVYLLLTAI
jgi:DnaJ-class molecular chaperone with C-terminal Zn finger domain